MSLEGDWDGFQRAIASLAGQRLAGHVRQATFRIGQRVAREAKTNINRTLPEWAPLAPSTIEAKGSSKPLIHEQQLVRSIDYRVITPFEVHVGAYKVRRGPKGEANVALIMESGAEPANEVDYSNLMQLRVEWGSADQKIPARPYLGPALFQLREWIVQQWALAVVQAVRPHV